MMCVLKHTKVFTVFKIKLQPFQYPYDTIKILDKSVIKNTFLIW